MLFNRQSSVGLPSSNSNSSSNPLAATAAAATASFSQLRRRTRLRFSNGAARLFANSNSNTTHSPLSRLLRGLAVVLVVSLYLSVFCYFEHDLSYETVMAVNQQGEEALQTVLAERNATRLRRAEEREARWQARRQGQTTTIIGADGEPVAVRSEDNNNDADADDFNLWRFMMFYLLLRFLLRSRLEQDALQQQQQQSSSRAGARRAQRLAVQERQRRFRAWADRLNRQRSAAGQRPLSLESLQLVLRERELHDGQDYDGLLQFHEESGPAVEALIHSGGLTQAELERLPLRVMQAGDDLLRQEEASNDAYFCSVCLEAYAERDNVRTLPCLHAFHQRCIDDWLSRRAVCPICKHSALG